jgi:hypothetical protein
MPWSQLAFCWVLVTSLSLQVSPPGWDAHEAQLRCPDEYEIPGGALNLNSTKLPRSWSPRKTSPSRKNPHGRTGNRTRVLMISSQKLWSLDHEAGPYPWTRRLERESGCLPLSHVEVPYRNMLISERVVRRKMEWLIRMFRVMEIHFLLLFDKDYYNNRGMEK